MCSFSHDHNPPPVVYGVRLKKEIKTRYAGMTIIIPTGAYAYINKTVEFDEHPDNFCHFCIFFAQNTFIPPKSYAWIDAWVYENDLEMLGFKNLYMFKDNSLVNIEKI